MQGYIPQQAAEKIEQAAVGKFSLCSTPFHALMRRLVLLEGEFEKPVLSGRGCPYSLSSASATQQHVGYCAYVRRRAGISGARSSPMFFRPATTTKCRQKDQKKS